MGNVSCCSRRNKRVTPVKYDSMDIDEFTSHIFQPEKQNEFNVILTDFINNFNRELAMTDGFDNLKSLITIFKNKLEENFGEWHLELFHKSLENDKFVNCAQFSGRKVSFHDAIKIRYLEVIL